MGVEAKLRERLQDRALKVGIGESMFLVEAPVRALASSLLRELTNRGFTQGLQQKWEAEAISNEL